MKYSIPTRLGHVIRDDREDAGPVIFLLLLPDGDPFVLRGSAALIWLAAADGEVDVAGAVARSVGSPRADVVDDVDNYLDELVTRGLLEINSEHAMPLESD